MILRLASCCWSTSYGKGWPGLASRCAGAWDRLQDAFPGGQGQCYVMRNNEKLWWPAILEDELCCDLKRGFTSLAWWELDGGSYSTFRSFRLNFQVHEHLLKLIHPDWRPQISIWFSNVSLYPHIKILQRSGHALCTSWRPAWDDEKVRSLACQGASLGIPGIFGIFRMIFHIDIGFHLVLTWYGKS